jgi:hypothetical protein
LKATTIGTWRDGVWVRRPWPAVPGIPTAEIERHVLRPAVWEIDEERLQGIVEGRIDAPAEVVAWCASILAGRGHNEESVYEATGGASSRMVWTWADSGEGWRGVITLETCTACGARE